ncbi:transporter substrate-binding domain-containing protein [Laribacter hongkongensis]|uniref:transporter substrate-binding domain-containing protein n=1 Tax=Laribacter hongkongensis TaxID=168471 RepID=UPI001EFE089E|nr:transporter substrate-binding domain-containing protein [Laribacter hongkongensis]MCG9064877.1 transporter substrate-binding domain-containing protein [Laribacter hongkongensis]
MTPAARPLCRFLLLLGLWCGSQTAAAEWLRFGIDGNYPPFASFGRDGQLQGFDVDIANALCDAMQRQCLIVPQDWDGLIPALNANKFDAILSSMSITAERRKAVDFTDRYYRLPSRMLAAPGTDTAVGSFRGKRIGTLLGSTQQRFARSYWGSRGAEIVAYPRITSALDDLAAGRLAGVFVDALAGEAYLSRPGTTPKFTFVGPAFDDPAYFGEGAGIAVRKGNVALQTALNAAIGQIRADGRYDSIRKKYFSHDIYGKPVPPAR